MTAAKRLKWSSVNQNLDEPYRKKVVETALKHFPLASKELRTFAQHELSKAVQIPGFHRFASAPYKLAYKNLLEQFEKKSIVAFVVIALWAEARSDLIRELIGQVSDKGLKIQSAPEWKTCKDGYYALQDLDELNALFQSFIADRTADDGNDFLLAGLWIGTSFAKPPNGNGSDAPPPVPAASPGPTTAATASDFCGG